MPEGSFAPKLKLRRHFIPTRLGVKDGKGSCR